MQIDNSKLYGLYRCRGDNIIYKDDQIETAAYMACAYGGIQKLLNLNEAAFDP